ncbi:MAG: hypothetical protein QXW35_02885 [Candidatus Aenigmatarchaeota archaeon]
MKEEKKQEQKKQEQKRQEIALKNLLDKKILVKSKVLHTHENKFYYYEYIGTYVAYDKIALSIVLKDATIKLKEYPSEQVIKFTQQKYIFINLTTIEAIIPLEY